MRGQLFRDEDFGSIARTGRDRCLPSGGSCCSWKPSRGVSTSGGRWRWGSRWRTVPSAKSTLPVSSPADPPRPGASRLLAQPPIRPADRLPERTADEGSGCTLGRGAVKDTYPADGIVQVVRALAQLDGARAEEWALRHGLALYFGSSVKGEAGLTGTTRKSGKPGLFILLPGR